MPRKKPTLTTDVIGNLDLNPEDAVGDYMLSRQQEQYFVKPPNWDSAGDSIEMMYICNLREHDSMLALQKELLASAKRQTELNLQRIRKMNNIQERLRKRFIEVNSFIKDCADKKRIAEKIISQETARHLELTKGIDEYTESVKELKTFRNALKATVSEFQPYEKVLDDVVKVSDIFVSHKDCMDRCDALMLAQVEINKLEQQKIQEIEEMRQRMIKVTNEAALTVLGLKNDLAKLERSYNQSRTLCLKWEKILSNCKDAIVNNDMDKERTMDGTQVLYRLLCKRRDIDSLVSRRDLETSIDFIKTEIEMMLAVLRELERRDDNKTGKASTPEGTMC